MRLLPPIVAAFLLNYLDRFNLSFAGLQMEDSLGLTAVGFGFAGSCFSIGYLLFQVPADFVLMRVGARRWLALVAIGTRPSECRPSTPRVSPERWSAPS